jgi:hypothetical protein
MNRELRYKFHSTTVEEWITSLPPKSGKHKIYGKLEKAFIRIFDKAAVSVSEITLIPVLDRILYNSSEKFPLLSKIKISKDRPDFSDLKKSLKKYDEKEIKTAFHYLLTEFLMVLGYLTGEQLTPLLHKEFNEFKKANHEN